MTVSDRRPEIIPLEMATFRFADEEPLDGQVGVVMAYVVRHREGVLLFDTGFGFGNPELDAAYAPRARPIVEALTEAGVDRDEVTALANCHLHADHAGQNAAFPGIPIFVQPVEWESAHEADYTVLDWIDFPGARYEPRAGDHDIADGLRIVATPGHTRGHQSLLVASRDGPVVLAGQACYSVGEWIADPDGLDGRGGTADVTAYDRSVQRLRDLDPVRVLFAHDRAPWVPQPR